MNYELKKYYLQTILAIVLTFAAIASVSAQNPKSPQPSLGEESPDSVRQLYEVTVTSKQPMRTIATSQTMSGADLQALSTTSVADALKYFAGVQIKDYGGLGGLKTINVRSLG
ncbi:MAG: TonB-dependent receptor plug domain-containing protein, partial [Bacteroidales bacterium]|nr:TonB-dependent receptor plug domain-containing protein [Bacteroidales bacterium]